MVVKTVEVGEATLVFHDDCCRRSETEVKAILDRIAAVALPALRAAELGKQETGYGRNQDH